MNRNPIKDFLRIEMAEVIPNFAMHYDIDDLLKLIAPRDLLIVSADSDIYAQDAKEMYMAARSIYERAGAQRSITLKNVTGEHALDSERFHFIINWFKDRFSQ